MTLPATTWNLSYTFVAMLTSALVSVLAVVGSMLMLLNERVFADFDAELPVEFLFFSNLGIAGVAAVWLGFLAVVGGLFLCERQKIAVVVVLAAAVVSSLYFFVMLLSSLRMLGSIMWSVM